MKTLFALTLVLYSSFSFSADLCKDKQVKAAKKEASEFFDTLHIDVIKFKRGRWTEMVGGNTGVDLVFLGVTYLDGEEYVGVKYAVSAQQIGNTSDCEVINVQVK